MMGSWIASVVCDQRFAKHLQAFGGTGVYQGYKVGRVLRNVVFVANGFVKSPANPGSVVVAIV